MTNMILKSIIHDAKVSLVRIRSKVWCPIASILLVSGCASSQLEVDPDYRWVGGRTYTANIKKLQAYSKCELPKCDAANDGEFAVVDSNIEDLRRPLKMVVFSDRVDKMVVFPGGVKHVKHDWELYLYHVVSDSEKGVEVVTTVCKSNYGRFEPIRRKEVVKYVRESPSEECKEWRNWAICTNHNELTTPAPSIMFGQGFYDVIQKDILDQIEDTSRICGFDDVSAELMESLLGLQRLGLIEISGTHKMVESLNGDQTYANRVRNALGSPFGRLLNMASSALGRSETWAEALEIVKEMSERVAAKKIALKKQLDEKAELARKEQERLAEEKRVAEERRKREEAETLERKQAEDKVLLDQLDESISEWKRDNATAISKITTSDDPLSSFVRFVKGGEIPLLNVPNNLQLAESKGVAEKKVSEWNRWREISVNDFTSTDSGVRAKAVYSLQAWCNCLDGKIWDAFEQQCVAEEGKVFNKSFYKKEIPIGSRAVDLSLSQESFRIPSNFTIGTRYSLIHAKNGVGYLGFKGAELGSCFDRNSGAYNVSLNTGIYKDLTEYENIIVSGIGDDVVTGSSLPVDTEVIYKGTIEGHNRFGNVIRLRHFEVFDADKLNLAEVSAFEIGNGCKGVKIDGERFFFLFAGDVQDAHRIGGHSVGDMYIFRKNHKADEKRLMTLLAREGGEIVGMFGVRLGQDVSSLSKEMTGEFLGKPILLSKKNGGGMLRRYDYKGNRGLWDNFIIETFADRQTIRKVIATKEYQDEDAALSDAAEFRDFMETKHGVSLSRNPLAKNVWVRIFEQEKNTVVLAQKVEKDGGKCVLSYSMSIFQKKNDGE